MKTSKKIVLIVFFTVLLPIGISAEFVYTYDAAGNRVSRAAVEQNQPRRSSHISEHNSFVTVSPTVTSDLVTIVTTLDPEHTQMCFMLCDLQGSTLAHGDITSQQTIVTVSQYANGIYLLSVLADQNIQTFKIVKR